jgi:hypothetical protein
MPRMMPTRMPTRILILLLLTASARAQTTFSGFVDLHFNPMPMCFSNAT